MSSLVFFVGHDRFSQILKKQKGKEEKMYGFKRGACNDSTKQPMQKHFESGKSVVGEGLDA